MNLQDQLKKIFPDHQIEEKTKENTKKSDIWLQKEPLLCKYEKRRGKPITIIEGYTGAEADFKILTKQLKINLGVGGSYKEDKIIIQGDYREQIIQILESKGFKIKRVGG